MAQLLGAAAEWAGKIYSGGWVDGGGPTYAAAEPATGRQLAKVGSAAPDDVRRAVQRAREAQRDWATTPYDVRARVLRRAADLLEEHQEEVGDWWCGRLVCLATSLWLWVLRRSSVRPPGSPALP